MHGIVRSGFPFNYDQDEVSEFTGLSCGDRSLAVQSAFEETDINTIVRRFHVTGQLPQGVAVPSFIEFNEVFDYQTAMNVLLEANKAFMQMPAEVRARFGNDPAEFVAFVDNDANREEAERLGVIVKKRDEVRDRTEEVQKEAPADQTSSST